MNKLWADHEKQFIMENSGRMKDRELAATLTKITGRIVTLEAVRKQRQGMGVKKRQGRELCEVVSVRGSNIGIKVNKPNGQN